MKKIDFKNFSMRIGIAIDDTFTMDAREGFANLIYTNVNGIAALSLAQKIFKSEGEAEFDEREVEIIKKVAEEYCTPRFIDSINALLSES